MKDNTELMKKIENALEAVGDYGKVTIQKKGPGQPTDLITEKRDRVNPPNGKHRNG